MTLQEKIDKLTEIECDGNIYRARFAVSSEYVFVEYYCTNPYEERKILFRCGNKIYSYSLSRRLENVVDQALTIVENKEWEQ